MVSFPILSAFRARSRLDAYHTQVDREEVKGLTDPKVTIKGSSWMTQSARNAKFMTGLYPIVMRYLKVKKRVARMRKQLKSVDREAYYDERTAMWDEAHEREAKAIRKLFDSMGGLYNKLAQDWARSRRFGVLRRLHAIAATRVHQTRSWVVSFWISGPFGHRDAPRRRRATASCPRPGSTS